VCACVRVSVCMCGKKSVCVWCACVWSVRAAQLTLMSYLLTKSHYCRAAETAHLFLVSLILQVTMAALPMRVAIVGGSIGGLAAATAFVRLGALVRVFEKSETTFAERGSSIGFCDVNLWRALTGRPMIRRGREATRQQGAFLYGDLWKYLADGLPAGVLCLGKHVTDLGPDALHPSVDGEAFDVAVIAEGAWSSLRTRYFGPSTPQYAGWQAWRMKVPLSLVPGWAAEGEYFAEHYACILMKIAKDNGEDWIMGGAAIAAPEATVVKPWQGMNRHAEGLELKTDDPGFLDFFRSRFGHHAGGELCRAMEAAATHGKITPNPQYEYCAERLVNGSIVLVGDAAHTAVPRTAAGAHTAVQDGMGLYTAFQSTGPSAGWVDVVSRGLQAYEPGALQRARGLYRRSLQVSAEVLPPGWSAEAARTPMDIERAATLSVDQLKAELAAR
jgi:salicylate hydroxylase